MTLSLLLVLGALAQPAGRSSGVQGVLWAQPVHFATPHPYPWQKGHAPLTAGTVLVLQVDPDRVVPRQVNVPVLYVGPSPAELINTGWPSGRLLVLVPGEINVAAVPAWFGSTELPERVDALRGQAELDAALSAGFQPMAPQVWAPPLTVPDSGAFYRAMADLVETWAPQEAERARGWRAPPPASTPGR